jgi:hypothetical protein
MARAQFPALHLIENSENLGFARANNQALQVCQGKYALLLNSDAFLTAGAAQALVAALQTDPHAGIAGARLTYPGGGKQWSRGRLPALSSEIVSLLGLDKFLPLIAHWHHSNSLPRKTGMVSGACMLLRRTFWEKVGLFDENFFMFSEEADLCKRAHMAGWRVLYAPSVSVIHVGAGSSGQTAQRVLNLYYAKLKYFKKHHGLRCSRLLYHAMRTFSQLKSWFYHPFHPQRSALWHAVHQGLRENRGTA